MTTLLSTLDDRALTARLHALVGDERRLIVEFLQHLAEAETRRTYIRDGYSSLWDFCLRALHLSEAATGRRIGAMRILRRFPAVEAPLRDGRLNLTTLTLLGPVVTAENVADLVERATFKSRAQVDALVASIHPRHVAADGLRRLPVPNTARAAAVSGFAAAGMPAPRFGAAAMPALGFAATATPESGFASAAATQGGGLPGAVPLDAPQLADGSHVLLATGPAGSDPLSGYPVADAIRNGAASSTAKAAPNHDERAAAANPATQSSVAPVTYPVTNTGESTATPSAVPLGANPEIAPGGPDRSSNSPVLALESPPASPAQSHRSELRAVTGDQWSLRVTLDGETRLDLETLRNLLSHKIPDGNLSAVIKEALQCAVAQHGKRKGAVRPKRTRRTSAPARRSNREDDAPSDGIPAEIRRQVWERDGGKCTYVATDGTRCGSQWQLELHHEEAKALGGPPTLENLALRCRPHNVLHAEEDFSRDFMERFRRRRPGAGAQDRRDREPARRALPAAAVELQAHPVRRRPASPWPRTTRS